MEEKTAGGGKQKDYLGIIAIMLIIGIYLITGLLMKPAKENDCSSNGNVSPLTHQEYCVYSRVTVTKCVKLNERVTVCNDNIVNSLLNK